MVANVATAKNWAGLIDMDMTTPVSPFGVAPSTPPDVQTIIRQHAAKYGLDPEMMLRIARVESGLNPNDANPKSSARGLYQFMTAPGGSWHEYGRGGNPLDPVANADAGMRYTLDNQKHLRSVLGRDPTPGETYLAHQQGRAGAAALLQNPDRPAIDAISRFYKNPQTARDAIVLNGGRPDMTAAEFAAKWVNTIDRGGPVRSTAVASAAPPAAPMSLAPAALPTAAPAAAPTQTAMPGSGLASSLGAMAALMAPKKIEAPPMPNNSQSVAQAIALAQAIAQSAAKPMGFPT